MESSSRHRNEEPPPAMPARSRAQPEVSQEEPSPPASPVQSPAAALAGIISQKTGPSSSGTSRSAAQPVQYTPEASDEEPPPALPQRPASQPTSPSRDQYAASRDDAPGVMASPPLRQQSFGGSNAGYHLYHIHEMVSHMGHNRKMPTILGINTVRGSIIIVPENGRDRTQKEWTADKLTNYSIEGKHVFVELVQPSESADFHAGSKDTATEIVGMLGELAGAARAEGLREVMAASAGTRQKKGHMVYEFMAQGDDEVTVAADDEVIVLDDTASTDWWKVRRVKNGKEGVVPADYVEVTGESAPTPTVAAPQRSSTGRSTRDQNRMEEERLAREAVRTNRDMDAAGVFLPDRHSSLGQHQDMQGHRRSRSDSKSQNSKSQSRVLENIITNSNRT